VSWRRTLAEFPSPCQGAVLGAIGLGVLGGIAGLVIGLIAYPPTAWVAVFELGLPAAFLGTWLGLIVGALVWLAQRIFRLARTSTVETLPATPEHPDHLSGSVADR
jgi:hypothetical protein